MRKRYSAAVLWAWYKQQAQYWELICLGKFTEELLNSASLLCGATEYVDTVASARGNRITHICKQCVLWPGVAAGPYCGTDQQRFHIITAQVLTRKKPLADLIIAACERLEMLQRIAHCNGAPILTLEQWWEERFGKTLRQSANEIEEEYNGRKTAIQRSDAAGVA